MGKLERPHLWPALMPISGGVRSIIELIILSEIEKRTGLDIPIRCFFDLIIGSRYYFPSLLAYT